jgi:hypothetical protein
MPNTNVLLLLIIIGGIMAVNALFKYKPSIKTDILTIEPKMIPQSNSTSWQ